MPSSKSTTCVLAAMLASSNAFIAPNAIPRQQTRSSATVMAAEKPNALKTAAVSLLAGVVSLGSVLQAPADAALFSETPTVQVQEVGFGMPNPSKDPKNNNAESGKVNGPKYDPQQYGQFAKDNSVSSIDYGSAKGTDFGKTAGSQKGVATNTKATDGDFLADAKQNTREGVQIAPKNTADAANVDFSRDVSQQTRGSGTLADGIQAAKDVVTGGTRSSNGNTAQASSTLTSGLNLGGAGDAIKNKVNQIADQTSDLRDPNVDKSLQGQTPEVGGLFSTDPKGQADKVGQKTANKVKSDINTVSNARQNSPFGGNSNPGQAIKNKVGSDVRTAQNAAPDSLNDAGNAIKNKVGSDVRTAQNAAPDSLNDAGNAIKNKVGSDVRTAKNNAPNSFNDAGRAVKNKVGSDVNTAKRATNDATPNGIFGKVQRDINAATNQDSSPQGIADRAQDLLTSQIDKSKSTGNNIGELGDAAQQTGRNIQNNANNAVQGNAQEAKSALEKSGVIDSKSPAATLLSANNIPGMQKEGNVGTGGGLFGINSQQQAQKAGDKTVQKVENDIETARANPPFQGSTTTSYDNNVFSGATNNAAANNAGNAANQAGRQAKQTANNAGNQVKKQWQYVTKNDAGRAAKNKVNSDINNTKQFTGYAKKQASNVASNAGNAVNQNKPSFGGNLGNLGANTPNSFANQPDGQRAGGLFSTNPKQQADVTGQKTAAKVSSDVNTLKKGLLN